MSKIVMQLDGLTCPSCVTKIEGALAGLQGVKDGKVLFNAGKVKAEFEPETVTSEKISRTIERLGYEVQSVKVTD